MMALRRRFVWAFAVFCGAGAAGAVGRVIGAGTTLPLSSSSSSASVMLGIRGRCGVGGGGVPSSRIGSPCWRRIG